MREKLNCNFSQFDMDAIDAVKNICTSIEHNLIWQGADSVTFYKKDSDDEEIRTYTQEEIYLFTEFLGYLKEASQGHINAFAEGEDTEMDEEKGNNNGKVY